MNKDIDSLLKFVMGILQTIVYGNNDHMTVKLVGLKKHVTAYREKHGMIN
jgi:hypothetical protein